MKSFLKLIICSIIIKSTSEFISTNLACDPLKTTGLVVLKGNCFADSKTAHFQNCHLQCLTGTFEDTSHSSRTLKCINGQWFEGSFALPSSYELTCNQNRDVIAYKTKIKSFFSGLRPLFQCPALTIGASVEVLDHGCNPNENESCVLFCQNGGFSNPEIKNQHSIVINCNKELGMLFYVLYKSLNFQLLSFTPKCYLNGFIFIFLFVNLIQIIFI